MQFSPDMSLAAQPDNIVKYGRRMKKKNDLQTNNTGAKDLSIFQIFIFVSSCSRSQCAARVFLIKYNAWKTI